MKLLKKLSVVFILTTLLTGVFVNKAHAAIKCDVKLSTSKKEVSSEEKFSIYVKMANIQAEEGIIAISSVLEYDKKSLTLEEIKGENKWPDPTYNDKNGKLVALKNKFATKDENVFKITFKVNKKAEKSAWVKVNNFEISNGKEEKNVGGNSITVGIKSGSAGTSSSSTTNSITNSNTTTNKPTENSENENNSTSENIEENTNAEDENNANSNEEVEQDNSTLGVLKDDNGTQKIEEGKEEKKDKKTWGDYARYIAEAAVGVGVVAYIGHHIRKPKKRKKRR